MVERIRLLLETRQFTPTQFADAIGVARPIVSHILSGRNKPSLEVVQRILAAMPDLSMPWLLNGTGPMQAAPGPAPTAQQSPPKSPVAPKEVNQTAETELADRKPVLAPAVGSQPVASQSGRAAGAAPIARAPQSFPGRFESQRSHLPPPLVPKPGRSAAPAAPPSGPTPEQPRESAAPTEPPAAPAIVTSSVSAAMFAGAEKPIRRIVIFYRDGSFADYQPE